MSDDERAIRQLVNAWMAASKAGDVSAVLAMMTDDVVFLVAGRPPLGKTEFAKMSASMKDMRIDGRSTVEEINVLGDWAYLRSHIELTITPPNGSKAITRSGNTLTILRREADGRWRIARDANLLTTKT